MVRKVLMTDGGIINITLTWTCIGETMNYNSESTSNQTSSQVSQQGQRAYQSNIRSNPSWCYPPPNKLNFSPQGQREHTAK